jgi:hypothetical protein
MFIINKNITLLPPPIKILNDFDLFLPLGTGLQNIGNNNYNIIPGNNTFSLTNGAYFDGTTEIVVINYQLLGDIYNFGGWFKFDEDGNNARFLFYDYISSIGFQWDSNLYAYFQSSFQATYGNRISNEWYHVVLTSYPKVYINGNMIKNDFSYSTNPINFNLRIGSILHDRGFKGYISNFFGKQDNLLTDNEVKDMYDLGHTPYYG